MSVILCSLACAALLLSMVHRVRAWQSGGNNGVWEDTMRTILRLLILVVGVGGAAMSIDSVWAQYLIIGNDEKVSFDDNRPNAKVG